MIVAVKSQHSGTTGNREHNELPTDPLPMDHKLFIIAQRCGRLANRLVLFANFIALAEEQGHRLINFTFHSYAELFETTSRDIYCQYPPPRQKSWLDLIPFAAGTIRKTRIPYHAVRTASKLNERHPSFCKTMVTLRETAGQGITPLDGLEIQDLIHDAQTVFVYGWNFRAPDYVQRHAEKIRAYFRPIVEYEQASRQAVDRLRQSAEVVVGVHVRHGDYPTLKGGKFFFAISQYATWMHEMSDLFPGRKVSFLVCSDEPRNCHEFPGLTVGFGTGTPVGDLYSLAKCDYLLGPLSTFSQWASFYGEKPLLHFYDSNDRVELEKFRVSYLAEIP